MAVVLIKPRKILNRSHTYFIFILILLFYNHPSLSQSNNDEFLLSSGSVDGNYYKVGKYISQTLDSIYGETGFINVVSTGSLENVKLLDDRFSDFAILQRDVLLDNIYDEVNGLKNIEMVLPLFQENFLIYTKCNEKQFSSFENFAQNINKVGFTSKDGYSYKFFLKLCKLTGINSSKILVIENSYSILAQMLEEGLIDAMISFSLPIKELEKSSNVKKIGLSADEASLVSNRVPNVFLTKNPGTNQGATVGSWTFLVGLETSISEIGENISMELIEEINKKNDPIAQQIKKSVDFFKNEDNHTLLQGIPLTSSLTDILNYNASKIVYLWVILVFILSISIIYYAFIKNLESRNNKVLWMRYKHIIIGTLCILALYFFSVEWLLFSEKEFYRDLGIKSRVLNLTRLDLHFWIIVTNLTGNNNNIFPFSYLGQLLLPFSSYILWIGAAIIASWEFVIYKINRKRLKGMAHYNFSRHIVIVGWKENSLQFVEELLTAKISTRKVKTKIVFMVENPESISESSEKIKTLQISKTICFVAGDAREENALKRANIHQADTVVILSEGISTAADEKTLLRALAISRYCKKMALEDVSSRITDVLSEGVERVKTNKFDDSKYIIAELNNNKYRGDLKNSGVNEIINANEYSKNIIIQSLFNHGISKVLDEVLTYDNYNEFYVMDLKEERFKSLQHKTFDELLPILRKKGILLIAIRIVYHDADGHEITDESRLQTLLKNEKLQRQILVNPTGEIEIERKADKDDQLIVLCTDGLTLNCQF